MPGTISVRSLQASIGTAYAALAVVAAAKSLGLTTMPIAMDATVLSYMTARTVPDVVVPLNAVPGVCGISLATVFTGLVADAVGGQRTSEWAAVVLSYCAGNRFRAAGIGPVG